MIVVAIDGPAGAGKSTVAAALSERLDLPHVDTGAFYRAATLAVLRSGVDVRSAESCAGVVEGIEITRAGGRTFLDGEDVEDEIRGSAVTAAVSAVSAHPPVRALLLRRQQEQIGPRGGVVEGRDAGTAVAPDAALKVWLTASARERAVRRATQVGDEDAASVAEQHRRIVERDARDAAQMTPAGDAMLVDTTGKQIAEVVEEIAAAARERMGPVT